MANRRQEGYDNEVRLIMHKLRHNGDLHAYTAGQNGADVDWHRGGVDAGTDLEWILTCCSPSPGLQPDDQEQKERLGGALDRIRRADAYRPGYSTQAWTRKVMQPPATQQQVDAYSRR